MLAGRKKRSENENKRLDIDKKWAHHQRFLRAVESLALEHNLPAVADEATQKRYTDLLAREQGSLGHEPAVADKQEEKQPEEKPVATN